MFSRRLALTAVFTFSHFIFFHAVAQRLTVEVKNPTKDYREEIVGLDAAEVRSRVGESFRVLDRAGLDLPFQLSYDGKLLLQASVRAHGTAFYDIVAGAAPRFDTVCHGSLHPERKDDFAWENDRGAYRVYGPALQRTGERSFGIDVWTKNSPELVVDQRYHIEDVIMMPIVDSLRRVNRHRGDSLYRTISYHHDHGRGLDPYRVGATLGCGAPALMIGDSIVFPYCFKDYEILDDGPLRFTVHLIYHKVQIGQDSVVENRIISLDKGSNFNSMTVWYEGLSSSQVNNPKTSPVTLCSGVVIQREDPEPVVLGPNYVSYTDPTDQPNLHQAPLYVAVLFPDGEVETRQQYGHALGVLSEYDGSRYTYYFGSAWAKYDVRTPEEWNARISWFMRGLRDPLQISLR